MSEQPYDPYIPSGSNGAAGAQATATQGGDPKTQQVSRVSFAVFPEKKGRDKCDIHEVTRLF